MAYEVAGSVVDDVPVVRTEYKLLAHMRVENPQASPKELAAALGYSHAAIRHWLKTPDYQRFENWLLKKHVESLPPAIRNMREDIEARFTDFAGYMQERLLDIVDTTEDPKLVESIAQDWLDRAGFAPVKKQLSGVLSLTLTPEAVQELLRREREAFSLPPAPPGDNGHPTE